MSISYLNEMFGLSDRVIVVTGGVGSLGTAIASSLTSAGAKVALIGRTPTVHGNKPNEVAVQADVTSRIEVENAIEHILHKYGTITCLINNAGVYFDNKFTHETFMEDWRTLIDVNLTGAAICTAAVSRTFIKSNYGKIINIGSAYSAYGHHKSAGYTSSKTGIIGLTRAIAAELGRNGVRANTILPGWFDTKMNAGVPDSPRGNYIQNSTPLGRWGVGTDLSGLTVFLCSGASDFISGAEIRVDGGYGISDRDYAHE